MERRSASIDSKGLIPSGRGIRGHGHADRAGRRGRAVRGVAAEPAKAGNPNLSKHRKHMGGGNIWAGGNG